MRLLVAGTIVSGLGTQATLVALPYQLYVETRSWTGDLRLILLSFWISLLGTWEVRGRKY